MADKTKILLACMPKSGSSFLSEVIAAMPDFHRASLVPASAGREQELCIARVKLQASQPGNFVAQHHVRMNVVTEKYMNLFGVKPIVLVRDIFDVLTSFHEFIRTGRQYPIIWKPEAYNNWSSEEQLEFVVRACAAWYVHFYVSWAKYNAKLLITYAEATRETNRTLRRISDYVGLTWSEEDIAKAVETAKGRNIRLNVGKSGRGAAMPDEARTHVLKLIRGYRNEGIDFSPIGVPDP